MAGHASVSHRDRNAGPQARKEEVRAARRSSGSRPPAPDEGAAANAVVRGKHVLARRYTDTDAAALALAARARQNFVHHDDL